MEEVLCVICGQPTRVPLNTRRVDHVCHAHRGQVTQPVGVVRGLLNLPDLMTVLESNAAVAIIDTLLNLADDIDHDANANEAQAKLKSGPFDRDDFQSLTGQAKARREVARQVKRLAHDLTALTTSPRQ